MSRVLVFAPHPDDETLGCGGSLLKHLDNGDEVAWCICSEMTKETGKYSDSDIQERENTIKNVSNKYSFNKVFRLGYPTCNIDQVPLSKMIGDISDIINSYEPIVCYLPFPGDVHSDHKFVFQSASSCLKSFRQKSVKKILLYQTLSETEFGINPVESKFVPNYWVDISDFIESKIDIMKCYSGELGCHPFPRSELAMRSQAILNGAVAGCESAECFMLLKSIN